MCSSVIPSAWTSYFPLACVCSSVLSQFSWNFSFVPHLDLFRELSSCSCALLHFWPPDPHEQGCCRVPFSIFCPCIGCRPALAAWSSGFLSAQALSNFGLIFSFPTPELVFPVVCERAAKVGFSSCTQDLLAFSWLPPCVRVAAAPGRYSPAHGQPNVCAQHRRHFVVFQFLPSPCDFVRTRFRVHACSGTCSSMGKNRSTGCYRRFRSALQKL
jgi:hypothetical protein